MVSTSVREYVFFVFFSDFKKTWLFTFFWNDSEKKRKKSVAKIFILNDANIVTKKKAVCSMSTEILASKLPDVMGTYRRLSHTVLCSCILSCVHTSEQDVWCWWPWLTYRYWLPVIEELKAEWLSGLWNYVRFFTFFTFFFKIEKTRLFTFFEWLTTFSRTLVSTAYLLKLRL